MHSKQGDHYTKETVPCSEHSPCQQCRCLQMKSHWAPRLLIGRKRDGSMLGACFSVLCVCLCVRCAGKGCESFVTQAACKAADEDNIGNGHTRLEQWTDGCAHLHLGRETHRGPHQTPCQQAFPYTHSTPPTNRELVISVVVCTSKKKQSRHDRSLHSTTRNHYPSEPPPLNTI